MNQARQKRVHSARKRLNSSVAKAAAKSYLPVRNAVEARLRERLVIPPDSNDQQFSRLRLPYEVMVYFADIPVNMYQIRQWLAPFEHLNRTHPVMILTRNTATYATLLQETTLPVVKCRLMSGVDDLVRNGNVKMCLYVNQNQSNFHVLSYADMLHVFLSHGESEKIYSISNQAKAYDYVFVAGDAAIERIEKSLLNFSHARLIPIGRPSIDLLGSVDRPDDGRITVLYAPTWEGDRASMAYGSIKDYGVHLVESLIADKRFRLVVRPHPRSGAVDPGYREALQQIRRLLHDAVAQQPDVGHRMDEDPLFGPQMLASDVMISDVSAAAIDYLSTGKPLIVTRPVNPAAFVEEKGMLTAVYQLRVSDLDRVAEIVADAVADDPKKAERQPWARHHFGDITPGSATRRFLDACDHVIEKRDELIAKRSKLTSAETRGAD